MAAMYELSRTPTPGMFLRNRSNAVSVRARRRKVLDQNGNDVENTENTMPKTPNQSHRRRHNRYSNEYDESLQLYTKSEEHLTSNWQVRERAYSNEWERKNASNAAIEAEDLGPPARPVSRRDFDRKSENYSRSRSRTAGLRSSGPMETLDRRISASTDNLDTLKRERRTSKMWHESGGDHRPRSVSSRKEIPSNNKSAVVDDDITFRIDGEKMSKNRYFFGGELKSAIKSKSSRGPKESSRKPRKTAVDIFLEDQGPYSRKLYGPAPNGGGGVEPTDMTTTTSKQHKSNNSKTRPRSQDQANLLHSTNSSSSPTVLENSSSSSGVQQVENSTDDGVLKKGLLWQQRDKLFSRWKERYFILTKDYFHCFKKATSRITEMGGFIFKLKLTEVETIELLDKRGYLTICINLLKDGKIYLRRPEGIREWFAALQNNIYECKRRRKFWVKRQVTDSTNIEHWLLTRQKLSGYNYGSGSSPNILNSTDNGNNANNNNTKANEENENDANARIESNSKLAPNLPPPPQPRAVSRSAMVKAVVASETQEELVEKPVKNVCLVDKPQIFPSGNSMTTRAVIESSSGSSTEYVAPPNPPKGINRMSLVNELISREKSEQQQHHQTCQESTEEGAMSSSSSIMAESSAKSNSARSSMQSTTASNSSTSSSATPTNDNNNNTTNNNSKTRLDADSSNDSGHNSMNTNSSDSQSDGTNSGSEEKSSTSSSGTSAIPSSKSSSTTTNNNTIKITNIGHSMKIHVDGGTNFGTSTKRMDSGKDVDVDLILKPSNPNSHRHCDSGSGGSSSERPALLPRPPPSLTKPSIMKYRGKQP